MLIMRKNILICAPPPDKAGGVSNYYRVMRKLLAGKVEFFTVNRRFPVGVKLLMNAIVLLQFIVCLIRRRIGLVLVNPSLGPSAVLRDGILLFAARCLGVRRMVFWRGWDLSFQNRLEKHRVIFRIFRKIFFSASGMLVLSTHARDTLRNWGYAGEISLMTTMCPDEIFEYPFHLEKQHDKFRFLFLARIEEGKGIYESVDAFAELAGRYPDSLVLTIAGDGAAAAAVEEYVRRIGCSEVEFAGYLRAEAKYRCFDESDCYLLPSYSEGMPGSLLESMAAGLPALVTPVGGIPDFFRDGEMGYLVKIRDRRDLFNKMEYVYQHPEFCRKAGAVNREFAAQSFRSSLVAERLLQLLTSGLKEL